MRRSIKHCGHASRRALLFAAFVLWAASLPAIAQQDKPDNSHGNAEAAKLKNPAAKTPESIAAGKRTYQRTCGGCHGPGGKGDGGGAGAGGQPRDLTDGAWQQRRTDGEIFAAIRDGVSADMMGYGEVLSETDIWNLVNFIRSIGPQSKDPAPHQDSTPPKTRHDSK